ncbi:RimJ/RimL family protein N-acetyltransferase [Chitinophaga skermanii]|uniref:RimJ/RimL family protein N-acetyltransferase n=1 Tax=Chitinophaga skermanii TaxID=331697 RepID=A0A327Q2W4_9BACT|nr:GNAT family N-acetyltransferase [Chitinophaga skermanii]RAI98699.1 RimJ/RimL family protein N-acetyltransferase [Chitinophaga skermanii]
MIETARLQLLPCTLQHFEAFFHGNDELSNILGIEVPENWTEFPEMIILAYDKLRNDPSMLGWFFYFVIHKTDKKIIGTGGFKGRPSPEGVVEIGYEISEDYRENGYASEAVEAFIRFAFHHQYVNKIIAHTLEEYNASVKVLQKNGLHFAGTVNTTDGGILWEWQISREAYAEKHVL